jgi:flagellin
MQIRRPNRNRPEQPAQPPAGIWFSKECADMPQTINTNIASLNAQRNLNTSQASLATSMQRLSSGLRVNSAKDDAAGMAIAERMNTQVRGMNVAIRNSNDAISLAQTAEGAIGKVGDMLQRMRELAVQSANATNGTSDRVSLDQEFQALADEIDRTLATTKFNGLAILAGAAGAQVFQVGPNSGDTITVTTTNLSTNASVVAVTTATSAISTVASASAALGNIDAALDVLNSDRAIYGAAQSRFESVISNLQVSAENQAAARSRIMDADFAAETANLSRAQILQQAGTAMVAQANQLPQQVLQLLRS